MNPHRKGNAFGDNGVPGDPRLLDAVGRRTPKAGGMRLTHTHTGTIITGKKQRRKYTKIENPYDVTLITTSEDTYEVTVGWGYVCERIPGPEAAVINHEPANQWDEEDDTKLRKFPTTPGQAVYIKVNVTAEGTIGQPAEVPPEIPGGAPTQEEAVAIYIGEEEEISSHYIPKVNDETSDGAPGYYYYKLASLEAPVAPSTTPTLTKWLSGSHIDHFQDLPSILSTLLPGEGIGCIIKEWSESHKAYRLRTVNKGLGKNTITTLGEYVEVRGTKKDGSLTIVYGEDTSIPEPQVEWSDGYWATGVTIIGDEPEPPPLEPITLMIPHVRSRALEPQVTVATVAELGIVGRVYEVTGNGKKLHIKYQIGAASVVSVATFDDGLTTTGNAGEAAEEMEVIIPIPAAGNGKNGTLSVTDYETSEEFSLISWTNGMVNEEGDINFISGGGGGGGSLLPLSVTSPAAGTLSVSAGSYQVGATGAWVAIAAAGPATGTHVHLVIVQDISGGVTSANIVIGSTALDPVVMSGDPAIATSNVLIYDGVQRRHGNFTLSLWQIDGDVVRWAETLAGGA